MGTLLDTETTNIISSKWKSNTNKFRFGRGMYVAFWASGIAVLSVISLVFTPSRIENEDYEVNHQSRSYKYHTGCKADDLKVYV